MKTVYVAVCDDDPEILGVIGGAVKSVLAQRGFEAQVQTFTSGRALLETVRRQHIHLVLLDIEMPMMDGIHVGQKIRELSGDLPIVYVSACESRVFDAFRTEPLCFVRKSRFLEDIAVAAELFRKNRERAETDHAELVTRSGIVSFRCHEILYIEGQRNYQQVYLADGRQAEELKMTMDALETQLGDKGFIRIHKGYLVNHSAIQRIDGLQLTLRDGTVLPIGRSRVETVKTSYIRMIRT